MKNKTIFVFTVLGGLSGIILGVFTVFLGFVEANTSNMIISDETFVTLVFLGLILGGVLGVSVGCFLGRHFSTKWAHEVKVLDREWKGIRVRDGIQSFFISLGLASFSMFILMFVSSILESIFNQSSSAVIGGQILRVLALWLSFVYGWHWLVEEVKPKIKWRGLSSYDIPPLYDENYNPISYDYLPNSSDSDSGTTYRHTEDLFGNKVSYGSDGSKLRHGTDFFGNEKTWSDNGTTYRHTEDLFGNEKTYGSDGSEYRHAEDLFGNEKTYGSDGSEYSHDKDIFGNSRTRKLK